MTRCLVIGHSGIASGLVRAAREIVGPTAECAAFDVVRERRLDAVKNELRTWLDAQMARGPALLLTDLPGATPHNLAMELAGSRSLPVVAGANLPMLLRALNHSEAEPGRLAALAAEGGLRAIVISDAAEAPPDGEPST